MIAHMNSLISIGIGLYFFAVGLGAPLPPNRLRGTKYITVGAVVTIIGGLAGIASTPSKQQSNAEVVVRAVKTKLNLPYQVDEITMLDDVKSGPEGLTYVMTLSKREGETKEIVAAQKS